MGLWGVGIQIGGTLQGGIVFGGAATGSLGIGIFGEGFDLSSISLGGFLSGGAFVGGPGHTLSAPGCPDDQNGALGLFGGVGVGGFWTNATRAEQLSGPFKTASLNAGAGEFGGSIDLSEGQDAQGNNIDITSVGIGPGLGISGAQLNTTTNAGTSFGGR